MRDIVGIWRLISDDARDQDGTPLPSPYGPSPMGVAVLRGDGRMMAMLCDGRPPVPGDATGRVQMSYCGSYSYDGTTLSTRVDATSDPARLGTDQVRNVSFDGDLMVLRPPVDKVGSATRQRALTWERIGPA